MIGDPETRYREDPVRMLRAARFAAKLDFTLHPGTEAPIHRLAYMLDAHAVGTSLRRDAEDDARRTCGAFVRVADPPRPAAST